MSFEEIYKNDIFANEAGVILEQISDSHAVMSLKIEKRHLNGGGMAHGGAIYLLADVALAAIANHKQPISVSIQSDIRFFSAAKLGDTLTAEAVEVFARKSTYNGRVVITNQDGEMVAVAEGMLYTKRI